MPREIFDAIRNERRAELRSALAAILPAARRIVLEIGCGNGHFLTAYAAAHPDRLCVGIDLRLERIHKALRKRDRAGLAQPAFSPVRGPRFPAGTARRRAACTTSTCCFPIPGRKNAITRTACSSRVSWTNLARGRGQGSRLFFRTDYRPTTTRRVEIVAAHPRVAPAAPGPVPVRAPDHFPGARRLLHSLAAAIFPPEGRKSSDK